MKRYVFILFVLIIFILLSWTIYSYIAFKYYSVSNNDYNIKIDRPIVKYKKLDKEIDKKINSYVKEFKKDIIDTDISSKYTNTLIIYYKEYDSVKYLSYVFFTEIFTGGAHPSHDIWTINYDKDKNKIINIGDLIKEDNNILNKLSMISRKRLVYNKRIVDTNMLNSGTIPNKNNFSNFILTDNDIIIYFKEYQIAPYSSSYFELNISLKELNLR